MAALKKVFVRCAIILAHPNSSPEDHDSEDSDDDDPENEVNSSSRNSCVSGQELTGSCVDSVDAELVLASSSGFFQIHHSPTSVEYYHEDVTTERQNIKTASEATQSAEYTRYNVLDSLQESTNPTAGFADVAFSVTLFGSSLLDSTATNFHARLPASLSDSSSSLSSLTSHQLDFSGAFSFRESQSTGNPVFETYPQDSSDNSYRAITFHMNTVVTTNLNTPELQLAASAVPDEYASESFEYFDGVSIHDTVKERTSGVETSVHGSEPTGNVLAEFEMTRSLETGNPLSTKSHETLTESVRVGQFASSEFRHETISELSSAHLLASLTDHVSTLQATLTADTDPVDTFTDISISEPATHSLSSRLTGPSLETAVSSSTRYIMASFSDHEVSTDGETENHDSIFPQQSEDAISTTTGTSPDGESVSTVILAECHGCSSRQVSRDTAVEYDTSTPLRHDLELTSSTSDLYLTSRLFTSSDVDTHTGRLSGTESPVSFQRERPDSPHLSEILSLEPSTHLLKTHSGETIDFRLDTQGLLETNAILSHDTQHSLVLFIHDTQHASKALSIDNTQNTLEILSSFEDLPSSYVTHHTLQVLSSYDTHNTLDAFSSYDTQHTLEVLSSYGMQYTIDALSRLDTQHTIDVLSRHDTQHTLEIPSSTDTLHTLETPFSYDILNIPDILINLSQDTHDLLETYTSSHHDTHSTLETYSSSDRDTLAILDTYTSPSHDTHDIVETYTSPSHDTHDISHTYIIARYDTPGASEAVTFSSHDLQSTEATSIQEMMSTTSSVSPGQDETSQPAELLSPVDAQTAPVLSPLVQVQASTGSHFATSLWDSGRHGPSVFIYELSQWSNDIKSVIVTRSTFTPATNMMSDSRDLTELYPVYLDTTSHPGHMTSHMGHMASHPGHMTSHLGHMTSHHGHMTSVMVSQFGSDWIHSTLISSFSTTFSEMLSQSTVVPVETHTRSSVMINFTATTGSFLSDFKIALTFDGDCKRAAQKRYTGTLNARLLNFILNVTYVEDKKSITVGPIHCSPNRVQISFRNADKSTVFLNLNNQLSINGSFNSLRINSVILNITGYEEIQHTPRLGNGGKVTDTDITIIAIASCLCLILVAAGIIIFAREIYHKKISERFSCSRNVRTPVKTETVALTSVPARNVDDNDVEMNEDRFVNVAYYNNFDDEYSTLATEHQTTFPSSQHSSPQASKDTGKPLEPRNCHESLKTTTSSPDKQGNGSNKNESPGYGLIIGLMGYTKRLERQQHFKEQHRENQQHFKEQHQENQQQFKEQHQENQQQFKEQHQENQQQFKEHHQQSEQQLKWQDQQQLKGQHQHEFREQNQQQLKGQHQHEFREQNQQSQQQLKGQHQHEFREQNQQSQQQLKEQHRQNQQQLKEQHEHSQQQHKQHHQRLKQRTKQQEQHSEDSAYYATPEKRPKMSKAKGFPRIEAPKQSSLSATTNSSPESTIMEESPLPSPRHVRALPKGISNSNEELLSNGDEFKVNVVNSRSPILRGVENPLFSDEKEDATGDASQTCHF